MHREIETQLLATWLMGDCKEDLRYFIPRDFKDGHNAEIVRMLQEGKSKLAIIKAYTEDVTQLTGARFSGVYEDAFREAVREIPLRCALDGEDPEQVGSKIEDINARLKGSRSLKEETTSSTIGEMRTKIEDATAPTIVPTGFKSLDGKIDGGLRAGLYVIGAISSLGKTSFSIQLADNIAKSGTPVLFVSLEMAREELVAKIISRLTYERSQAKTRSNADAKTTTKILNTHLYGTYTLTEQSTINEALAELDKRGDKLVIYEGIGNVTAEKVKAKAKQVEKKYGTAPVVFVDYLQILAPEADYRGTDKQATDKNVLELKRLSRDLNTPVFCISSFNRDNYNAPVSLASFKESGAIEYTADVLLGLQLAGMDYQDGETDGPKRRDRINKLRQEAEGRGKAGKAQALELKILKNRNGSRGSLRLDFVPMFNHFADAGTIEADPLDGWEEIDTDDIKF